MNYKENVLPVLREAKQMLLSGYGIAEIINQKSEIAADVVTELDIAVEIFVRDKLKLMYPDIPFVGEEFGGDRTANKFWLMDPIDGTGYYIRGLPFCTTMLALIDNGQVVFSAIYHFVNDDMYWAQKGGGAYKNEEKLQVSHRRLKDSYISWETHLEKAENKEIWNNLQKLTIFSKILASGWEFTMIAAGKIDARVTFDPYGTDYDFAPGSLLVSEAGGKVANISSNDYDYRNTSFIAANPLIYSELTEGNNALFPIK